MFCQKFTFKLLVDITPPKNFNLIFLAYILIDFTDRHLLTFAVQLGKTIMKPKMAKMLRIIYHWRKLYITFEITKMNVFLFFLYSLFFFIASQKMCLFPQLLSFTTFFLSPVDFVVISCRKWIFLHSVCIDVEFLVWNCVKGCFRAYFRHRCSLMNLSLARRVPMNSRTSALCPENLLFLIFPMFPTSLQYFSESLKNIATKTTHRSEIASLK